MSDVIKIVAALILPPVAVLMHVGFGKQFWINLLLTLCVWFPGVVHALWVISRK
ncbi:Proteolipid membrane potential modulator [Polystyrenella longa]|uniref:Proteolipid membrane potential modulator n=1 Tax=Polystyrenella longa TaxID=2528007 RepID=A0A518CLK0_9PLAN|nr:YqaE/Pmp3 family membrane protein [Polystyrenella longa]QDU80034.1 Proteolipid membrane potential modulator [Polystyrenella longa]